MRDPRGSGPERVTFDSLDRDPATGAPVRLAGLLFRPGGRRRRPSSRGGRLSRLRRHVQHAWLRGGSCCRCGIRRWRSCSRRRATSCCSPTASARAGCEEICTIPFRRSSDHAGASAADAQGALAYLQSRAGRRAGADRGARLVARRKHRARHAEREEPAVARWKDRPGRRPIFAPPSRSIRDASTRCARGAAMPCRRR